MPGYTGHVPSKQLRFGLTAGRLKREVIEDCGRLEKFYSRLSSQENNRQMSYFSTGVKMQENKYDAKLIYGNRSRFAKNWISGPKDEVREQQVPGYTGHIKGLIAENFNGENYANCTARAIYRKGCYGYNIEPKYRFLSQNQSAYVPKNFRRIGKFFLSFLI
jgi:hypothetical protein